MNGKGSTQRPLSVAQKVFNDNFDRIFNRPSRKKIEWEEMMAKEPDFSIYENKMDDNPSKPTNEG